MAIIYTTIKSHMLVFQSISINISNRVLLVLCWTIIAWWHHVGVVWTVTLPGQMGELGVHRAGDHFCVDGTKLMHTIAESYDLSRADKGAEEEIKQQQHQCKNIQSSNNASDTDEAVMHVTYV